jgi:hypothetical protein
MSDRLTTRLWDGLWEELVEESMKYVKKKEALQNKKSKESMDVFYHQYLNGRIDAYTHLMLFLDKQNKD